MSLLTGFRKEWMELIRSYRLLVAAIVLLFFGLTSPVLAKFTPELLTLIPTGGIAIQIPPPTVTDAFAQYVKNMGQFGILLALLLTMGSVAQEKDKGTAAMILVKPMPRAAFLGAKFLGLAALFAICILLAGLGAYYYTVLLFQPMDILSWLLLNVFLFVYIMVIVAVTLFSSTLMKSQISAGGLALGLIIVVSAFGSLLNLGKYLPGELITWGMRLMQGNLSPSWIALGVSLGLIVVALFAAGLVFQDQEL
jgi:ABC-2 type transport system permease protein